MPSAFYLFIILRNLLFFFPRRGEKNLTLQDITLLTSVNYLRGFSKPSPLNFYIPHRNKDDLEGGETLCKSRFSEPKRAHHSFNLVRAGHQSIHGVW